MSLWFIWCKLCTYLASRLTLSQTDRIQLPLEPRHLGVPSGVPKMISEPMVRSARTVHLCCVKTSTISKQTELSFHFILITMKYLGRVQNDFSAIWYVWRKLCPYLAPILTQSLNRLNGDSTWPTSPRSSIECVQNNFWAYGIFGTYHEPILRQD
jgi:hypothetical protein